MFVNRAGWREVLSFACLSPGLDLSICLSLHVPLGGSWEGASVPVLRESYECGTQPPAAIAATATCSILGIAARAEQGNAKGSDLTEVGFSSPARPKHYFLIIFGEESMFLGLTASPILVSPFFSGCSPDFVSQGTAYILSLSL